MRIQIIRTIIREYAQKAPGVAIESDSIAPAPSTVQRELVGPYQLLRSGMVDLNAGTITLPLYRGQLKDGRKICYILTDTDDKGNVEANQLSFPGGKPDYSIVEDKVMSIDPKNMTVTLKLTQGFSFAKPVLYLSTDANDPLAATLEGATCAPALKDIPVGRDDSAFRRTVRFCRNSC